MSASSSQPLASSSAALAASSSASAASTNVSAPILAIEPRLHVPGDTQWAMLYDDRWISCVPHDGQPQSGDGECTVMATIDGKTTDLKVPAWTIIKMKRKVCWECTNDDTSQCHGCDHYMCIRHGHFEYINNNRYVLCSSCHTTMWAAECRAADADVKARIEQKQKGQEDNMKYEPTEPHVEDEEQRDPGHCNTCRTESDCAECYMCYRKRQIQEETKRAGKKEEVKESKEEKALAPARGRKRKASVASASVPAPTPAVPQGASDVCPVCRQRLDGRVRVCTACKAVVCYTCNEGKGSTTCPVCHSDETHTMSLRKRRTHQGN